MVDASVPDIALEPDKTVKKVQVGTVSSSPGYAPGPDLEKTLKFNSSEDHNSKKKISFTNPFQIWKLLNGRNKVNLFSPRKETY